MDLNSPSAAPASTPPAPASPKEPFRLKAWHVIVPLIPVLLFLLQHLSCIPNIGDLLGIGKSKATAGPGDVIVSEGKVVFTPPPTKANPHPRPEQLLKAPDDKVKTAPNAAGGTDIQIERFAFILEPTFGVLWNGSFDFSQKLDKIIEPSFGIRLVKFSRIGLGPLVTPARVGAQLDWRIGNVTGAIGGAWPFDPKDHLGLVLSINAIPFN